MNAARSSQDAAKIVGRLHDGFNQLDAYAQQAGSGHLLIIYSKQNCSSIWACLSVSLSLQYYKTKIFLYVNNFYLYDEKKRIQYASKT